MKTTWISAAAVALTIGVTGVAHAQEDTTTPDRAMGTYGTTAPTSTTGYRPEGRTLGIGAGWTLPTDLGTPNTVSARVRMPNAMTFEPIMGVGIASESGKIGTAKTSASAVTLFAGGNVRKPLMGRNKVDVVGIVGAGLDVASTSSKDPAGVKTTGTAIGLSGSWGAGVEYWAKQHIVLSVDATNPALSVVNSSNKVGDVKQTNTAFFVGAIWDPTVRVMIHIFQ